MTWSLYYLNNFSQSIPKGIAENVIKSEDCIAILFLYLSKQYDNEIVAFCDGLDKSDLFLLDQYWLLLYQLFFDGKISNPYKDDNDKGEMFNTLKDEEVSFIESR